MQLQVLMLKQDDPKKCTAAKLVKFGLARQINKVHKNTLVLDPFAKKILLPKDKKSFKSIAGIDCSWNLADETFKKKFNGIARSLPPLFAGNPVNYAKLNKLTTVEALAGALYILGYNETAGELLDKFKWGHTFYELNQNLLSDYSKLDSQESLPKILRDYQILPEA